MSNPTHPPLPVTESPHPLGRPTTVRLSVAVIDRLDIICGTTTLTRNGLIGLAISAMLDHVLRTGKLPYPQARKRTRGGSHGIA